MSYNSRVYRLNVRIEGQAKGAKNNIDSITLIEGKTASTKI